MFSFKKTSSSLLAATILLCSSIYADYGPMTTCPGPYACALPSYQGVQATAILAGNASSATNSVLLFKDGHLKSIQTTAPTAAPAVNAGTGATCTVSHATDSSGTINLTTTAVSPGTGAQCAVTFNKAYNIAPICTLTAANANGGLLAVASAVYITDSTIALTVNFGAADAVGHAYIWNYICVETQ